MKKILLLSLLSLFCGQLLLGMEPYTRGVRKRRELLRAQSGPKQVLSAAPAFEGETAEQEFSRRKAMYAEQERREAEEMRSQRALQEEVTILKEEIRRMQEANRAMQENL